MFRRMVTRSLFLLAGLVAVQQPADPGPRPAPALPDPRDPRLYCVRQFFLTRDCPAHLYAEDFIAAADENGLDWRLLPSIAFIESTGGKEARNNNMFGWDNANWRFPDTRAGIYHVAGRLAHSPLYRNRDLRQILRIYNPNPEYAQNVLWVMGQLGPASLPPAGQSLN
ncbi:MAG: hypothetical protein NZR01_09600 [Bryobacteraceae bacterium]|nr:hypothetical protein [Bryobacteraceae bacterium]